MTTKPPNYKPMQLFTANSLNCIEKESRAGKKKMYNLPQRWQVSGNFTRIQAVMFDWRDHLGTHAKHSISTTFIEMFFYLWHCHSSFNEDINGLSHGHIILLKSLASFLSLLDGEDLSRGGAEEKKMKLDSQDFKFWIYHLKLSNSVNYLIYLNLNFICKLS